MLPDQNCLWLWCFTVKYCPIVYSFFLFPLFFLLLFPWWKLNGASPSATVLICMKLCPLLKAFLCCSTLWALSCLVFLLVTLLALTDSQVKCTLRAARICASASSPICYDIISLVSVWLRLCLGQSCIDGSMLANVLTVASPLHEYVT